jgi:hypothetical protein
MILTHSHPRNVTVIVDQAPLFGLQIQSQDMIVDFHSLASYQLSRQSNPPTFVSVLVEPSKGVDLIISNIGDGRINEACGPGTNGGYDLWSVAFGMSFSVSNGTRRHQESVV